MSLSVLAERLGYQFLDPSLLLRAVTHRSYGTPHYERLEFLGDAVLNLSIADILYQRFPDEKEGALSRLRAHLVSKQGLLAVADVLSLKDFLLLGEGEKRFFPQLPVSLLSNALEAIIGAVFIDGGFSQAHEMIRRLFEQQLSLLSCDDAYDPKTVVQECLQAKNLPLPVYAVIGISGQPHCQLFRVSCRVDAYHLLTTGEGTSRRQAEREAARCMLNALRRYQST